MSMLERQLEARMREMTDPRANPRNRPAPLFNPLAPRKSITIEDLAMGTDGLVIVDTGVITKEQSMMLEERKNPSYGNRRGSMAAGRRDSLGGARRDSLGAGMRRTSSAGHLRCLLYTSPSPRDS